MRVQMMSSIFVGYAGFCLVPKKAAGTAAGFTGFFGYVAGATIAEFGIGMTVQRWGWDAGFGVLLTACVLATTFLGLTWHAHERST